jgi:hypothetical protein
LRHPDFGSGLYAGQTIGIPHQVEAGTQAKVPVKFRAYASESDPGPMPIPANAPIEGYPKPGNGDRQAGQQHRGEPHGHHDLSPVRDQPIRAHYPIRHGDRPITEVSCASSSLERPGCWAATW